MKIIHAFTETTNAASGYAIISEQDSGNISVSVRTGGTSRISIISMDRDQLVAMNADINSYLSTTEDRPKDTKK